MTDRNDAELLEHLAFLKRNIGDWTEADAFEVVTLAEKLLSRRMGSEGMDGQGLGEGLAALKWLPIETAPRDVPIIYWHPKRFVSSCEWREPDEGVEGGWWDDAITEYVGPVAWLMPLPPTSELRS